MFGVLRILRYYEFLLFWHRQPTLTPQSPHVRVMWMIYAPIPEVLSPKICIHLVAYQTSQTRYRNVYAGNVRFSGVRDKCWYGLLCGS